MLTSSTRSALGPASLGLQVLLISILMISSSLVRIEAQRVTDAELTLQQIEDIMRAASPTPAGYAHLTEELNGLGVKAIPFLFEELDRCSDRTEDTDFPSAGQLGCLRQSLVERGRDVLLPSLQARVPKLSLTSHSSDGPKALVTLELLAEVGLAEDIFLAVDVARTKAGPPPDRFTRQGLIDAVAAILGRDERGVRMMRKALLEAPAGIAAPLLIALETQPNLAGLGLCADVLRYDSELDRLLVSTAGRLSSALPPEAVMEFRDVFRPLLRDGDFQVVREAALSLGRMEDFEAAPELASLLAHDDKAIRVNAAWSLQHMTGLRLPPEPDIWSRWIERQEVWLEEGLPTALDDLQSGDLATVTRALSNLAGKRYERHQIARGVLEVLFHPDVDARVLGCQVLGQIGSTVAVPELERLCESEDVELAAAATNALDRLLPSPRKG